MIKLSKKSSEVIYGLINKDLNCKKLGKELNLKTHAVQMRLQRTIKKNRFSTSNKFFYELGKKDGVAELYANISK